MTERLIESIKKISSDVKASEEPMNIVYGSVIKEAPIEILTGQKMILDEKRIVLTDCVRKVEKTVEVMWNTENNDSHSHGISGVKKMTEDNRLKIGDKVVMLKMQGGQKYIVLSKVVI